MPILKGFKIINGKIQNPEHEELIRSMIPFEEVGAKKAAPSKEKKVTEKTPKEQPSARADRKKKKIRKK